MSNYVQSTNFATKDALSSGDPLKIVKGTEINTEFNNIATAVATKADLVSPTFTGTVSANVTGVITASATSSAITQSFGNSSTLLATTAFVQAALQALHPVGSIYINATDSTNPGTLLGFGTWSAFGAGRVPVGFDAADPLFDSAEETGGSKDAIVVSHTHAITDPGHAHTVAIGKFDNYSADNFTAGRNTLEDGSFPNSPKTYTTASNTTGISIASAGSSGTNANLQPYITVFMWKRVS